MTTYHVSLAGSDSNNGLGPDASHASNKPFLTLGKCIGTSGVCVPGDTVYVGPGVVYEGATIACASGVSSSASPTVIRGDPANAQGFKDGSGVRLAPAVSWVSLRTTGDTLDGPITAVVDLFTPVTGCHGLQFYDLGLEGQMAANSICLLNGDGNADWLFDRCRFMCNVVVQYAGAVAATAGRNLTVRRCIGLSGGAPLLAWASTVPAASADADLNILFENNLLFMRVCTTLATSSSGGNLAGGIRFKGNAFICNSTVAIMATTTGKVSTVTPCRLEGNLLIGGAAVNAGTLGHVVDDGYNRMYGSSSTNFTLAGTSIRGFQPNLVLPDLVNWGLEMARADWFGWTDAAVSLQKYSAWAPSNLTDYRGRTIRPWGSGSSIGAHELGLQSQDTGSAITGGGTNSLKITGAGEVQPPIYVPVDAVATTLTITTKSTSYGGSNWPQMIAMPNPAIGVTQQTATATSASEQTLSVSFTPTTKGVIELRLISRSTSVSSLTYFDVLAG